MYETLIYLEILRSRDFCSELLILWHINRLRSIERPRSWTCLCFSNVSYLAECEINKFSAYKECEDLNTD